MVTNAGSTLGLLLWQWRSVALFAAAGTVVTVAEKLYGIELVLPTMPLAVVGAALGIFVSFRTNSAYARWWEGRQLWGRMVNNSRHFATQVLTYLRAAPDVDLPAVQRELVERHIAYVHALRCAVRKQDVLGDEHVQRLLLLLPEAERTRLASERNVPYALLQLQAERLAELTGQGALDEFRLQSFDRTIGNFLDVQGGCERIKNTPMPRGYGFIGERLVWAYACLLPFALVDDLGWLTIPINVLVCLSFALIGEAGRVLEDPFTMFWNGLPLSALSTTIEINLRQRLGDRDLPPDPKPNDRGILM
jgi:putative membrane protein